MQFLILANRTGRRPVLPGIAERGITDRTIYRSADRSNVEDLDQFLDLGNLECKSNANCAKMSNSARDHGRLVSKTFERWMKVA